MESLLDSLDEKQAVAVLEHLASFSGPIAARIQQVLAGSPSVPDAREAAFVQEEGEANPSPHGHRWQPDLRYRSLVEKLPVVTFMASLDDTVQELYVSPQIETLLGFTQEEWLDNPVLWFQQLHPDDRDKWVEGFARTCAEGANFRAEYRLFARDGRIVWVQGECQLIRDDDGRPAFLQGIAFDITHLKKAAEIEEAKRAAESANSAKSEFLARMSHEIRTPLNGVVGMIDLLAATSLSDVQKRYATLAKEAANSLLLVINDILDFSKIEAGKVEIEAIEFDLHKMIEDLTVLLAPVAAKKKLAMASFIRPQVPRRMIGDPSRVRQVLTNLITNAIKFTDAGQVSIRAVNIDSDDEKTVRARIEVRDTGIGIPSERLDRLFKSFSQVDTSTTRKFGGTGLGLVICKRLVELMGGEIGIDSELGKGTTFWFTLTFGKAAAASTHPGLAEALRSVRVLAVETEEVQRHILAEQLDGRLINAPVILDNEEILPVLRSAAAQGHPFNVALIPFGPQSPALAAAVKADPLLQQTRLIAITSFDEQADTNTILRGYFARLPRPLTQSHLIDTITSATIVRPFNSVAAPVEREKAHQSLNGLHVLVAEDNDMNQFVTEQTLQRVGCTCDIVGNGSLAIEAIAKKRYAAVLMDCQMPDMDGREAARRIRAIETAAGATRIPIIALTAEAIAGDREKCLAAGMDGYVSKPIDAEILFAELASVIAKPASRDGASSDIAGSNDKASAAESSPVSTEALAIPIDAQALLVRCMSDVTFAVRLLEKFAERAAVDVERVRAVVASGDAVGAGRVAHNLKSVAAHVSAERLRGISFEIEQAGARSDLQFIEEHLAVLDEEARRCASYVPQAIRRITETRGSGSPSSPPR